MITVSNISIEYDKLLIQSSKIVIHDAKITMVVGESGSGKTSLLYLIGLIEKNNSLNYQFDEVSLDMTNDKQLAKYRQYHIGYVFQDNNMLDGLTIAQNFEYICKLSSKEYNQNDVHSLLKLVRVDKSLDFLVRDLSGGQKQRLAIALALCKNPDLLVLDEPTSSLDEPNSIVVMEILEKIAHEQNKMILITTHSKIVQKYADVIYKIENKQLKSNAKIEQAIFNKPILSNKKRNSFMAYYLYLQFRLNRWRYLSVFTILSILIAFTVLFKNFSDSYTDYKLSQTVHSQSNEVIIANNQAGLNQCYYMEGYENISEDTLNIIKDIEGIVDVRPYDEWSINQIIIDNQILESEVIIVPYYNDFMEDEIYLNSNLNGEAYIDFSLYDNTSIDLLTFTLENETFELPIKGVVSEYFENKVNHQDNKTIIYIPYDIVKKHINNSSVYVLNINQISNINEVKNKLIEIDSKLGVFSDYINDTLFAQDAIDKIQEMSLIFGVIIIIIAILFIALVYFKQISNRLYEICLIKANGLSNIKIIILMFSEWLIHVMIVSVFSTFIIFIVQSITEKIVDYPYVFLNMNNILMVFLFTLLTMIIPSIITLKTIIKNSPAKLLRN